MLSNFHPWDLPSQKARLLQKQLAGQVIRKNRPGRIATVAGIDVHLNNEMARAAVVVLDFPGLEVQDRAVATRRVTFPYIPGLLSFREGPAIIDALEKLAPKPDLLIFDGHGVAHPRRLGIASHIGLLVDIPSIGCGKSRLCGQHREPGRPRGSHVPLTDKGETIGAVLRTRVGIKPVFVSVGHGIDLETSIQYVLACCRGYRLPETTRQAHRIAATV
jgi:deoxyribonuclease V